MVVDVRDAGEVEAQVSALRQELARHAFELRDLEPTQLAGEAKHTVDPKVAQQLLDGIGEIDKIFWETKKS